MFENVRPKIPPKPRQEKCEITTEKTAKGFRKKISSSCTREQIRALSETNEIEG